MSNPPTTPHRRNIRPDSYRVFDLIPPADLAASYALPSGRRRPGIRGQAIRTEADNITGRGADGRYGKAIS